MRRTILSCIYIVSTDILKYTCKIILIQIFLACVAFLPSANADEIEDLKETGSQVALKACQEGLQNASSRDYVITRSLIAPLRGAKADVVYLQSGGSYEIKLTKLSIAAQRPLYFADLYKGVHDKAKPMLRIVVGGPCRIIGGRQIVYESRDNRSVADRIDHLDNTLKSVRVHTELNPRPPRGSHKQCVKVALLDNGVNYNLSAISVALAYDKAGNMLGHDFWEYDDTPFEFGYPVDALDPRVSAFNPRYHGTGVGSVFLDEVGNEPVCIIPYRYHPVRSGEIIGGIFSRIAEDGAKIVILSSGRQVVWPEFAMALQAHPELLVIAAAGNNGMDLGKRKWFPADYVSPNLLVVGAANEIGARWPRSNYGKDKVHLFVPAVDVAGISHDGAFVRMSGTSLAAPRVAALAAKMLVDNRELASSEIKISLINQAKAIVGTDDTPTLSESAFQKLKAQF